MVERETRRNRREREREDDYRRSTLARLEN